MHYAAPSEPPNNLTVTSFDFTNVSLQWDPVECSLRNGEIDGYSLMYYPSNDQSYSESIWINDGRSSSFTLIGLQPQMTYTLRLVAVNDAVSTSDSIKYAVETVTTTVPFGIDYNLTFYINYISSVRNNAHYD